MTSFNGKNQNLQKTYTFFTLALIVSEILTLKRVDLQKVGKG